MLVSLEPVKVLVPVRVTSIVKVAALSSDVPATVRVWPLKSKLALASTVSVPVMVREPPNKTPFVLLIFRWVGRLPVAGNSLVVVVCCAVPAYFKVEDPP